MLLKLQLALLIYLIWVEHAMVWNGMVWFGVFWCGPKLNGNYILVKDLVFMVACLKLEQNETKIYFLY